ncbi:ADP-ribosylglycohydrolase family protein [Haloferula sp. A504]|uniref:ADP-ribosylglycohydrolase family protein n=1 Tax=Haloferula sp. A504 TaxID=3373601 RepID=UPI0031C5F334|nr:ADP-ribosylglycohydrolase family protein [Verrucomicrobiaceae bacterium E54]
MNPTFENAYHGSLVADALAMPAHWYYDREALRRDYGELPAYAAPRNPHPDSILWRSRYEPLNDQADILHDQAQYWGRRGVHYHQFLQAGENTVNFKLAAELVRWWRQRGGYNPDAWLERYIEVMRTPGWHGDTYVEEYHRGFFERLAQGKPPRKCSIRDEHIGGLALVPALNLVLSGEDLETRRRTIKEHVGLTHAHANVLRAADTLVRLLDRVAGGTPLRDAIRDEAGDWLSTTKAAKWATQPDDHVVGQRFSPACYIDQSMPASLFLAWKYHDDFEGGIRANALVGGDNCHRGAVVGSLLAAANGIPGPWLDGLVALRPAPVEL